MISFFDIIAFVISGFFLSAAVSHTYQHFRLNENRALTNAFASTMAGLIILLWPLLSKELHSVLLLSLMAAYLLITPRIFFARNVPLWAGLGLRLGVIGTSLLATLLLSNFGLEHWLYIPNLSLWLSVSAISLALHFKRNVKSLYRILHLSGIFLLLVPILANALNFELPSPFGLIIATIIFSLGSYLEREDRLKYEIQSGRDYLGKLDFLVEHDPVSGLLNRHAFARYLEKSCQERGDSALKTTIFCMDLDHFGPINNLIGTEKADRILQMVAERLILIAGDPNLVFRIGGDEFALVSLTPGSELNAAILAEDILKIYSRPFRIADREIYLSASIGISFVEGEIKAETVLRNATEAMMEAKEDRNTYRFFQEDLRHASFDRIKYLNALRHAIQVHELYLCFQPQVNEKSEIVGAEALIRWESAEFGDVPPTVFIPIAEESGLIIPIGEWVMEQSCAELQRWIQAGLKIPLSINLSARQLRDRHLERNLLANVAKYQIPPELLHLEITESSVISDRAETIDVLWSLTKQGFYFAIDDFGTGYASLTYLKTLPVHTVKIDKSFIAGLPNDIQDAAVVSAVMVIAKGLGLQVVAEGVEENCQADYLYSQNCSVHQGFLYSKPLSAKNFLAGVLATAT